MSAITQSSFKILLKEKTIIEENKCVALKSSTICIYFCVGQLIQNEEQEEARSQEGTREETK